MKPVNAASENKSGSRYEKSWDLLAELWQDMEAEQAAELLEEYKASGDKAQMDAFFAKYDGNNLRLIEKYSAKYNTRRLVTHTLPRVARLVAALVAAVLLVGGVTYACSPYVRNYFKRLLVKVTPEYTSFMLVENESDYFDVPADWGGEYFPSLIPDGLTLYEVENIKGMYHSAVYTFSDSKVRQFEYSEQLSGTANVDSEDAKITFVDIFGFEGRMISKEDRISIYWFDGSAFYSVFVRGHSEQEALDYARSLRKVK